LVVISIIIILMGLLFPAFKGAQDQAKRAQAKNDESQIVTAVTAYYAEYGKYPLADVKQGFDTLYGDPGGSYGNEDVFNVLRAIANTANAGDGLNARKVIFFSGTVAKDPTHPRAGFAIQDATGANNTPIKQGALVDPWGNTYMIAIDGDYDGATTDYLPYADLPYEQIGGRSAIRVGCFSASFGKDGAQGTATQGSGSDKKFKGSDDVVSWQ
jgi:type II secretory pathway pseudopilin PulG